MLTKNAELYKLGEGAGSETEKAKAKGRDQKWPDAYFSGYSHLGKWRQTWVDAGGNTSEFAGEYKDGAMRYEGETHRQNGAKILRRMTVHNLGPDRVRQYSELSTDGGKTWGVAYDFIYVRKNERLNDETRQSTADANRLEITYLANEGFLISGAGKKVLLDALFREGVKGYAVTSAPVREKLEKAAAPFDSVDLALATHYHATYELPKEAIDIAFVPYWYFLADGLKKAVREQIRPRHIVVMHIPPLNEEDDWIKQRGGWTKVLNGIKAEFPNAVIFEREMEKREFD